MGDMKVTLEGHQICDVCGEKVVFIQDGKEISPLTYVSVDCNIVWHCDSCKFGGKVSIHGSYSCHKNVDVKAYKDN